MQLKLFTFIIENRKNQRKAEHLLVRHSDILSLKKSIDSINTTVLGSKAEVLLNSDKLLLPNYLPHSVVLGRNFVSYL